MTTKTVDRNTVMPSATPTEAEIAAWNELTRDEQLERMRAELHHPDCDIVSAATMDDIRERGRALAKKLRRG